jgi:hypothetical protein
MSSPCPRRPHVIDLLLEQDPPADMLAHVADCAECAREWGELRALPRLLAGSTLPDPEEVHARTAGKLIGEIRRRRRRRQAAVAAAALVLMTAAGATGAAVSGAIAPQQGPVPAGTEQVRAFGPHGVRLTADLMPRLWGTQLQIHAVGLPRDVRCELIAEGPGQAAQPAGSWWSAQGSVASVTTATSWHIGQLTRFELLAGGRVLASAPVRAGSRS